MKNQQQNTTQQIIKEDNLQTKQEKEKVPKQTDDATNFCDLFRFADGSDKIMMVLGTFGAIALGASIPLFMLVWGDMTDAFNEDGESITDASLSALINFLYVGLGALVSGFFMITFWSISGERQASRCRKQYFKTLLIQQIGWFDCVNQSELSSNFSTDTITYQGAIGQKIGTIFQILGTVIGAFVVSFIKGWLMTFVCLSVFFVFGLSGYLYMRSIQLKAKQFQSHYAAAGGLAEQAISMIKTVKQMNGQKHEEEKFHAELEESEKHNLKFSVCAALSVGFLGGSMFLLYSLGYWYGSNCVEGNSHCSESVIGTLYTPGTVITIFFSMLASSFHISQLSPSFKKISEGKQAASRIFKILDRTPKIINPQNGVIIPDSQFKGQVELKNVTFFYPKDPSKKILDNISIKFDLHSSALVGQSGCGKSTILQLILRFYDPDEGKVMIDGHDLKTIDLDWLRTIIGYVGQQPVLFATTIKQNLLYGNQNASDEEINDSLRQAEALDFIYNNLEDKINTYVGVGGGQISGGQKQRIAIARALLKKPKILLLDEATSALDRRNERLIQDTLNKISQKLTTITVAHRVQSIMNSKIVYVIQKGQIKEKGTFASLQRYKDFINKEKEGGLDRKDTLRQTIDSPIKKQLGQKEQKEQKEQKVQKEEQVQKEKRKEEQQKERKQKLLEKYQKGTYARIFSYNRDHKCAFVVGIILTLFNGLYFPCFSIFLGVLLEALFAIQDGNVSDGRKDANFASLMFLILGISSFITLTIQNILSAVVGQQITKNLRKQTYKKMLKMPVHWFDLSQNNCGSLASRLSTDCQLVNSMTTTYIYIFIQSISTVVASLLIAFIFEWRTTLVAIACLPLLILAAALRARFRNSLTTQADIIYKDSANMIVECLVNIRTVVSFGVSHTVVQRYEKMLDEPHSQVIKTSMINGIIFGLAQILNFVTFGFIFYIGTVFVRDNGVQMIDVFVAAYSIFYAGVTTGNNSHFLPDVQEGKIGAANLFQVLDGEDETEMQKREQSKLIKSGIKGNISIKNLSFKYDSRNQYVFKNLNIEIKQGQKIAFVGPSGCGKSTIMQILQRFYSTDEGSISIDGANLKDYDIHYLRSQFGVVSQEPQLFDGSFKENIQYNLKNISMEEIKLAAQKSNALSFIEGAQEIQQEDQIVDKNKVKGFDKNVGLKGSHISGGQKQRVAITRAILRKPDILLLDQATSALDADNEKRVQKSLDSIMENKTVIEIAHRIQTIKNSNKICVFEKGQIVEHGTYDELIKQQGFFYNLERGTQFV